MRQEKERHLVLINETGDGTEGLIPEIAARSSVRQFLDAPVEYDKIKRILRAAMRAPSAQNHQPWEFLVIKDREQMQAMSGLSPYAQPLTSATLAIVPMANMRDALDLPDDAAPVADFWVQDMSACIQNILLQIVAEGLGGVWLGMYPRADRVAALSQFLGLPSHIVPFAVIALGYPAQAQTPVDRFNEQKIHLGRY